MLDSPTHASGDQRCRPNQPDRCRHATGTPHGPPGTARLSRRLRSAVAMVVLGTVATLWLLATSLASAALTTIPGDPLQRNMTIHVADTGQVQAVVPGLTQGGMFFPPSSETSWNYFYLRVKAGPHANTTFSNYNSDDVTPISNGPVTGNWTPNSPAQVETVYDVGPANASPLARVTQTTLYVGFARHFNVIWEVQNLSGAPLQFIAGTAADLYINGDDYGTGVFIDGPNRFVGGTNASSRKVGGVREVTLSRKPGSEATDTPVPRWASYEESGYSQVLGRLLSEDAFSNSIVDAEIDNGVGVSWDDRLTTPLPPGETARYEVQWVAEQRVPLTSSPAQATRELPGSHEVVLTMTDANRNPVVGLPIRWRVDGVNATPAVPTDHHRAVTNSGGQVVITIQGTTPGEDTIVAWADVLGQENGVRESAEPQTSAKVIWLADNRMDGAPQVPEQLTGPNGGTLPVGVIANPENPEAPTFTFVPGAAEQAGFPSCEFNGRTGRQLSFPLSVTLEPGAGTVDSAELLVVNPGSQDPNATSGELAPAVIAPSETSGTTFRYTVDCVTNAELWMRYTLTEGADTQTFVIPIGGLLLIDPQGVVHDRVRYEQAIAAGQTPEQARATAAITGATVRLQRRNPDGEFVHVLSGDPGITPNINPQITGANGLYQWDVAEGTYRVVVEAAGYHTHTSQSVDIPPPVLDLHIPMERDGWGDPAPPPAPGPAPAPTPTPNTPTTPATPTTPTTPSTPRTPLAAAVRVPRPTVTRSIRANGTRVRMAFRATLPRAARGRTAVIQRQQNRRWVAMGRVKVANNGRISRVVTIPRRTLGTSTRVRVRIILPATRTARASVGATRVVTLPRAPRSINSRGR